MTQFEKLDLLLRECGGTIQTFQVLNNGISKSVFYAYVKERGLEQAAHGVYVSPDTWTDAMYLLHLRCGQAVFSHETALFFHDLTDREPLKYTITVRTGYNPSRLQEDGFQVYTVKKDLHEIGIIAMQTSFGHSVPVYDMERTICDLLRSRKNVEMQVFQDALKQYAKRKDKNLRMLMKYAAMFHVENILRPYGIGAGLIQHCCCELRFQSVFEGYTFDKLQIYFQLRWHPLSRLGEPIKVIKKMKQTDNFKFAEHDQNKTSS